MKTKRLFIYSFAIMVVIRAIALCDFRQYVPYTELYVLYMGFYGLMIFSRQNIKVRIKKYKPFYAVALLAVYDVIFAFSNISVLDTHDVLATLARSLMMIVFVCVSAYWISYYDCLESVIRVTYIFMALFMTTLFAIYFPQTNLLETIALFWNQHGQDRSRNLFGFIVNNVAAEHALSVIFLSFFVFHQSCQCSGVKKNAILKRIIIVLDDIIMFTLIVANNSRGTLVISILMFCVYLFIRAVKKDSIKAVLRVTIVVALAVFLGVYYHLQKTGQDLATFLYFTNRMHFIANYKILAKSGRWLMGLGRTSGAFLAEGNYLYGLKTDYMEIFYVGVFIQTGIIGSVWIGWTLFTIVKSIISKSKYTQGYISKWIFFVFYYTLVMSLFEDYALTSLYITSTFFLAFIIAYCIGRDKNVDTSNE